MKRANGKRILEVVTRTRGKRNRNYVDAIGDCVVERRENIGVVTTVGPTDFVGRNTSRRNTSSRRACGQAEETGAADYAPGCRRGSVCAVAIVVPRGLDISWIKGPVTAVVFSPNDFAVERV